MEHRLRDNFAHFEKLLAEGTTVQWYSMSLVADKKSKKFPISQLLAYGDPPPFNDYDKAKRMIDWV
jgi:hypothetical protein